MLPMVSVQSQVARHRGQQLQGFGRVLRTVGRRLGHELGHALGNLQRNGHARLAQVGHRFALHALGQQAQ